MELLDTKRITLKKGNKDVKHIVHISDIHIRKSNARYEEYGLVFNELYKELRKIKKRFVIVITGDIFHEKEISPEQMIFVSSFFSSLTEITDVICIPGNHDLNKNNTLANSFLDFYQLVFDKFTKSRNDLFLLKDNCLYEYYNIIFGHTVIDSNKVTPCVIDDSRFTKIGLYHGIVHNTFNKNMLIYTSDDNLKVDDFVKYYDYTLLGDIHKHFFLNEEKTVVYSGSLIQQDFGEDLNHGYVLLDLEKRIVEFNTIKNIYGYVNIEVKDGKALTENVNIPLRPTIKLKYNSDNTSLEVINNIKDALKKKYDVVNIIVSCKCDPKKLISVGSDNNINILNINDNKSVTDVIVGYVKDKNNIINDKKNRKDSENNKLDDEKEKMMRDVLKNIVMEISNDKDQSKDINYNVKKFRLLKLEFSNYFVYGEKNVIDFSKLNGIIGINGRSGIGKSTLFDVLQFSLYGRSCRGQNPDIVNRDRDYVETLVEFLLNEKKYKIYRKCKVKKIGNGKYKIDKEIVNVFENDVNVSLPKKTDITKYLSKIFIPSEDFIRCFAMLQNNSNNIDITDPQCVRELICKTIGVNIFSCVSKKIKNTIKTLTTEQKKAMSVIENIGKAEDIIKESERIKNENNENERILEEIISQIARNKHIMEDIKKKQKELCEMEGNIEKYNEIKNNIEFVKQELLNVGDINSLNENENIYIRKKNEIMKKICSNYQDLSARRNNINSKIRREIDVIDIVKYQEKITKYNEEIKEINKTINQMRLNIDDNKRKIVIIKDAEIIEGNYNELLLLKKQYGDMLIDKEKINKELVLLKEKLNVLKKHEYDPKCRYCMNYPTTKDKMECEREKNDNEKKRDDIIKNIKSIKSKIERREKNEKIYIEYIKSLESNKIIHQQNDTLCVSINNNISKISEIELEMRRITEILETNTKNKEINEKLREELYLIDEELKIHNDIGIINKNLLDIQEKRLHISSLDNKLKDLKLILQDLKYDDNIVKKNDELNKEFNNIFETIGKLEEDKNIKGKKKKENEDNIAILDGKLKYLEMNKGNLADIVKKLDIYNMIDNIIGSDGIIDNLLSCVILPKIQEMMNNVLSSIATFSIVLKLQNKRNNTSGIDFFKLQKQSSREVPIVSVSGGENLLIRMAFLLAMISIDNNVDMGMLWLDETFVFLDKETVENIGNIFSYLRDRYKSVFIISHNNEITKNFDKLITIENDGKFSKIVC